MLRAAELLKKGELVGIPTETVYGLGANALDGEAVAKIFAAKGRPGDNPLIIHVTGADALYKFCSGVPERALVLAERFWPGPLTMVLPKAGNVPDEVTAGLDTVAVRCPDSELTLDVIEKLGAPIAAPSANISGHPSTTEAAHVMADMGGKIAAVLDGGPCRVGVESTIIDLSCDPPKLLRPGGITPEQLMESGPLEFDPAVFRQLGPDERPRAPGMKYRHYAPRGTVTLIKGAAKYAADYVNAHGGPERKAVLCFDGERELYDAQTVIEIGGRHDYDTQAERVFAALRAVDNDAIDTIFARCPEPEGVGLAVVNRLGKAAAHRVIEVGDTKIIGLTGPTGSGKTTALDELGALGAVIVDCDELYHGLLESCTEMLDEMRAEFPEAFASGSFDRKKLGSIVFADPERLERLNAITHKYVDREVTAVIARSREAGEKAVALDAIALIESGLGAKCDVTCAIVAPEERRVVRLMAREGISEEYARSRIAAQKPARWFCENTDITLNNDADEESFRRLCRSKFKALLTAEQ